MPGNDLKVEAATMAIARSMGAPGYALTYLLKRIYPLERLAMSTLASESKNGLEQLPLTEIEAIKGLK